MSDARAATGRLRSWARKPLFWIAIAAGAVLLAVVLYWFAPQSLLFDRVVDEEFPVVADAAADDGDDADAEPVADDQAAEDSEPVVAEEGAGEADAEEGSGDDAVAAEEAEPAGPVALLSGEFASRSRYSGEGTATIYELPDGTRTLRLEDFEVTNGPDLFVWLSGASSDDPDSSHDDVFYDLGVLSGNIGNQNYEIPDDVNLDDYESVIIWCERFSVGFAAADLS